MQLSIHDNIEMKAVHNSTIQTEKNDPTGSGRTLTHSSARLEKGSRRGSNATEVVLPTVEEYVSIY